MTVSSTVSKVIYAGNDSTVAFPVSFTFVLSSDLVVQLKDAEAVYTTLTETTHYTVSGAGDANGGTVTMLTAPATGETLIIYRDPPITQEVDYTENDAFPAETHEAALDLLTMIAQANRERIGRAIKLPVSSGLTDIEVAEPEASRVLVWNADEDALENGPTTTEIGNAQTYATNALASATAASASETNAGNSATAAATSAAAALASETAADTSETNAASSAAAALASETAADTSETNAASSAAAALASETAAETSEINAAASAAAALASETAASTSATNAASSASSALSSKNAAATSASNAASSATAAATSAADAATSEADAANSATAADTAKTGAEAAQTGAETAATNASNSATAAATSASNAATSATNAGNSATASAASASSAAGSAGTAATAATNAASSASDASDDADLAQAWAEGTEPGGAGTKSAKEWAEEAEAIAAANAAGIPYDNTASGLSADTVQELGDELESKKLDRADFIYGGLDLTDLTAEAGGLSGATSCGDLLTGGFWHATGAWTDTPTDGDGTYYIIHVMVLNEANQRIRQTAYPILGLTDERGNSIYTRYTDDGGTSWSWWVDITSAKRRVHPTAASCAELVLDGWWHVNGSWTDTPTSGDGAYYVLHTITCNTSLGRYRQIAYPIRSSITASDINSAYTRYTVDGGANWSSWADMYNPGAVTQLGTRTTTGTWTLTVESGKPVYIGLKENSSASIATFYVTSGADIGTTLGSKSFGLSTSNTNYQQTVPGGVIIPTATSLVIAVAAITNGTLYAYQ